MYIVNKTDFLYIKRCEEKYVRINIFSEEKDVSSVILINPQQILNRSQQ